VKERVVSFLASRIKFQRSLYERLLFVLFPDDLHVTFVARAACLCPGFAASQALFCELRPKLSCFPAALAQQVLRTWLNAWTTSRRIKGDAVHLCLFGCVADDDLYHYLRCVLC